MNKLQQEIIEIIEPYMDKTLSEGCLVRTNIKNYKITKVLFYWKQCTDYTWRQFPYILWINWNRTKRISKWEIIWHYDITAVLKYICDSTGDFIWDSIYDCGLEYINIFLSQSPDEKIPNKPLHLYSESENKELLNLLKQLKNQYTINQ